jgi:hypothetical protein
MVGQLGLRGVGQPIACVPYPATLSVVVAQVQLSVRASDSSRYLAEKSEEQQHESKDAGGTRGSIPIDSLKYLYRSVNGKRKERVEHFAQSKDDEKENVTTEYDSHYSPNNAHVPNPEGYRCGQINSVCETYKLNAHDQGWPRYHMKKVEEPATAAELSQAQCLKFRYRI